MRRKSWSLHITRRIPPLVGLLNRLLVRVPAVGERVASGTARTAGRLLPHASLLGFQRSSTYDEAIRNWENFLYRIGAEYDKQTDGPQATVYTFRRCPAGFSCSGHLAACQATMELDRCLVESSGAELIVEKRIPTDGVCVERIVARPTER